MFVTVRNTPTYVGTIQEGSVVINTGSDTVYLGVDPNTVGNAPNTGVPLFPNTGMAWRTGGRLWASCPANTNPQIEVTDAGNIPFTGPFVSGEQIIPSGLRSADYTPAMSGWRFGRDGFAEINGLGGTFVINNLGMFFYIPHPAAGNLVMAVSDVDGMDSFGNSYHGGLFLNQKQAWFTNNHSDTITLGVSGSLFPAIGFVPAGFNELAEIFARGDTSRLVIQNSQAGVITEINSPVVATAGIQAGFTEQAVPAPLNVDGVFTEYLSGSWAPVVVTCPPSETIEINMYLRGHNASTAGANVGVYPKVKQGATVLFNPTLVDDGPTVMNDGVSAGTSDRSAERTIVIGQDILAGFSGQSLTVVPCWRVNSHTVAPVINRAKLRVTPSLFVEPASSH